MHSYRQGPLNSQLLIWTAHFLKPSNTANSGKKCKQLFGGPCIQKQMTQWYFKLFKITHFVEPCVHVADSWSRIASAFDHHVDVERLLDVEKSQVLAAKMNKIKYRNRFENHFSFRQIWRTVQFLPESRELSSLPVLVKTKHRREVTLCLVLRTSYSH